MAFPEHSHLFCAKLDRARSITLAYGQIGARAPWLSAEIAQCTTLIHIQPFPQAMGGNGFCLVNPHAPDR